MIDESRSGTCCRDLCPITIESLFLSKPEPSEMRNVLWLCLAALGVQSFDADPKGGLYNLDFEEGDVGQVPVGWTLTTPEYQAAVTDENPKQGKRCVRVGLKDEV